MDRRELNIAVTGSVKEERILKNNVTGKSLTVVAIGAPLEVLHWPAETTWRMLLQESDDIHFVHSLAMTQFGRKDIEFFDTTDSRNVIPRRVKMGAQNFSEKGKPSNVEVELTFMVLQKVRGRDGKS